ncbi:MAG: hypothetical protein ABI399_06165 [Bauldia sp.]
MDHEVEHDVDIDRAAAPRGAAHALHQSWGGHPLAKRRERGRETLDMPNLQHGSRLRCPCDKIGRVARIGSNRFLDENVNASVDEVAGDSMMQTCWHHDGDRVHFADQGAVVAEALDAVCVRCGKRPRTVGVGDGNQPRRLLSRKVTKMPRTEVAEADNPYSYRLAVWYGLNVPLRPRISNLSGTVGQPTCKVDLGRTAAGNKLLRRDTSSDRRFPQQTANFAAASRAITDGGF